MQGLDAYEFATPKEILATLAKEQVVVGDDKAAFWDCFESKKWAIRKKAMEKVREAASVTRCAGLGRRLGSEWLAGWLGLGKGQREQSCEAAWMTRCTGWPWAGPGEFCLGRAGEGHMQSL
jgi:hypothetical protein